MREGPRDVKVDSGTREWETCPDCNGSGKKTDRKCLRCEGIGKIRPRTR